MTRSMVALAHRVRVVVAAAAALAAGAASAQVAQLRRELETVGVDERLGAQVPRSAAFTEEDGQPLSLDALRGRPVVLSFNYTSCKQLCSLQLAGLARALHDRGWRGEGFTVLTVSIDPAEQLPQLARTKQVYVQQAGGDPGAARAWHFVRGSKRDIDALAEAVGFRYRYLPATGEFAHQATLVVLTGDGRVSGYLHGISYGAEAWSAALDRAAAGGVASAAQQASLGGFLLTCIGFDPATGTPRALGLMRAFGVLAMLFLLSFVGVHVLRDVRLQRARTRRASHTP